MPCRSRAETGRALLQRVPEAIRTKRNVGGKLRIYHPAGVELRSVVDGPMTVTPSMVFGGSSAEWTVRVFVEPIWDSTEVVVDDDPTTIKVSFPKMLADLEQRLEG